MQAKGTFVTPEGNIVTITIDKDTEIQDLDEMLDKILIADEKAVEKGLKIMGRKLQAAGENAVVPDQPTAGRAGGLTLHCVSMDILPKPGGDVSVELFGDGFKQPRDDYAILYLNTSGGRWTVEKLVELFAPYYKFLPETFKTAGTFDVDFTVEYHESKKTNAKGNPYLDVDRITVAEGAVKPSRGEAPAPPPPVQEPGDIPF